MNTTPCYWAVVPAAGVGRRFASDSSGLDAAPAKPKQYQPLLLDQSVAQWTLDRLLSVERISGCVVALAREDGYWHQYGTDDPRITLTTGGAERADSVRLALQSLAGRAVADDWVLVHDIARPCVRVTDIERLMDTLDGHPVGGILAAPVADTVKRVGNDHSIQATEDRSQLWCASTPQMFRYSVLAQALSQAVESGFQPTDEASAVEQLGHKPRVVEGQRDNIKITRREDLAIAGAILKSQQQEGGRGL